MPMTFPSHQGAVLPLKVWRPRWFDGVALAVGAASPDVAYVVDGSGLPVWPLSHQQRGLILWCLPVTLILSWLFRRASAVIAAHLPEGGVLHLRDFGVLRVTRPRWWVTACSALIGAESHLLLDAAGQSRVAEWALDAAGGLVTIVTVVHVGRHRLLRAWHGVAPPVTRRPRLFWGTAAVLTVAGLAVLPVLPGAFLAHTTGTRILAVIASALIVGAAMAGAPQEASRCGWRRLGSRTR
jgi:hypothetical protein